MNKNFRSVDAARIVCELSNWKITNLRLQKILYIAQMVYAGRNKTPLITNEKFEAWDYGTVLPELFRLANFFVNKPIKSIYASFSDEPYTEEREFLSEIYNHYKQFTCPQLISITHSKNGGWAKNYEVGLNKIIPFKDIIQEYKTLTEN